MKKFPLIIVFCMMLAGCTRGTYTPEFLTDSSLRMEMGKQQVFVFDEQTCQYTYNIQRAEFRAHTDVMSAFYSIRLDHIPSSEGEMVEALDLVWTGPKWVEARKNITLEVVKLEGDVIWLWYSAESIKMTLRFQ